MAVSVTVAGLEMTTGLWRMTWDTTERTRTYTYTAAVEPRKVVDGLFAPLTTEEQRLLDLLGFDGDLVAEVVHDDLSNGGGPSAQDIATEQLAALTAAYQALYAAWVRAEPYTAG